LRSGRAHRDGRIDPRRPQRRDPAGDDSDRCHQRHHGHERGRVVGGDPEEQPPNSPGSEKGAGHAQGQADRQQDATLSQNHPLDPAAVSPETHANADLVGSRAHREGQHTGDAHGRYDQRQQPEGGDQDGIEAPGRDALTLELRHRHQVLDRCRRRQTADNSGYAGNQARRVGIGQDHQPSPDREHLRKWHEHDRPVLSVETPVPGVGDDADHRPPVAADGCETKYVTGPRDPLPDRVVSGEEPVRQRLVENHHQRGAGLIGREKFPAADQRNAGSPEKLGAGRPQFRPGHRLTHSERPAFCLDVEPHIRAPERNRRSQGGIPDAGQGRDFAPYLFVLHLGPGVGRGIGQELGRSKQRELQGEQLFGPEPGRHIGETDQGAGKQTGAGEQDHRDGHLHHHQAPLNSLLPKGPADPAHAGRDPVGEGPFPGQRGQEGEQQGQGDRQREGEAKHDGIQPDLSRQG
jgi:hypothetical protein